MSTRKPGTESKLKKDDMTVTNNDTDKTSASNDGANGGSSLLSSQEFPSCLLTPIKEHIIHLTREMQWPASREHDYAKTPEKIIPRGAISDHVTDISKSSKNKTWKKQENKKLEHALLNCHSELFGMRDMLMCHSRMAVTQHYRELLSLQMSLILEQQQQIQQKEAELVALRQEKQQLESRIERMDRRMSVMQRRSRLTNGNEEEDEECLEKSNSNSRVSANSQVNQTSPSASGQPSVTKSLKSSDSPPESQVQPTNKSTKRKLQAEGKNSEKKKAKLQSSEMRTAIEYDGIGSCDSETASSVNKEDKILIPSWRVFSPTPSQTSKVKAEMKTEDTNDDMYLKRHKKFEDSERKRKRWDLQRARTLIQHQYLLDRYKRIHEKTLKPTNQKPTKPSIDTFLPKPEKIQEIEISDTVPLMAFGCNIPYIEPREFELPWFNLDERDAKETIRTTRSRARASKSGSVSSPPSTNSTTTT